MRSIPVEWNIFGVGPWDYSVNSANIYPFWVEGAERAKPFESLYTVGMRGDGECKLIVLLAIEAQLTEMVSSTFDGRNGRPTPAESHIGSATDTDEC